MVRPALIFILALLTTGMLQAGEAEGAAITPAAGPPVRKQVVVIPVREQIAKPILYILRRGLKEAIEQKADVVVLDMKTPGGALDVTFDIMEALGKFPGETITYINTEAISAGAFISAMTDEIYFAPEGIIGAAAPVLATGGEIDKSMKLKIVSYLKARVRAISEGKGYRGQVISAMIDEDYELKIEDNVIKAKGELLSLTASEASKTYGDPPLPLLAAGIAKSVEELLTAKFGAEGYTIKTLEVTWSEQLAVWLNAISPILLGLGLVALFIEFKTPGFGVFGVVGGLLLLVVFLGNFVAGFSGHEPMLVFALGFLLVVVEIFFLPGTVVTALIGIVLMLGSLVWSMADIWPNEPLVFSGDLFLGPLQNLLLGLVLAVVFFVLIYRFLPTGWIWSRLAVSGSVQGTGQAPAVEETLQALTGREGVAATDLFPSGQVEIDGRRHEARMEVGYTKAGTRVRVVRHMEFGLIVEEIKP
jgi:membrane-bound serine protease (ClpP class)